MAALIYTRRFFASAKFAPASVRRAMQDVVEALETAPLDPHPEDTATTIPPSLAARCRRIKASDWELNYIVSPDGQTVYIEGVRPIA